MTSNNNTNYGIKILDTISNSPSGLTITEISQKANIHRNTVSKYLTKLEAESLVFKKEIGAARLYFSKKREYLNRNLVNSFLKAFLASLKTTFPEREKDFKKIGALIGKQFHFPITEPYFKEFAEAKNITDSRAQLKLFQKFYNSYDFFQDDLEISIQSLTRNKATFRIQNTEYLQTDSKYVYFFYIACGITEKIYLQNLNRDVKCDVSEIHISEDTSESYIEIMLEL